MRTKWFMCLATMFMVCAVANAVPTQWGTTEGGNGHYYEVVLVSPSISWVDAKAAAEGAGVYLATIVSQQENDFVTGLLSGQIHTAWGGGWQPGGSEEPAGGWCWVTGEAWSYSNWNGGEPNNNGDEWALQVFAADHPLWPSKWNDLSGDTTLLGGYIVEIPEPATVSLLALGGLAMIRRRQK